MNVATLVATLEAKTRDFDRALKKSERRLKDLEGKTKGAGRSMDKFGKLLKGAAALGAVKLGAELFKLGVQAEAWGKRYATVFGESTVVLDKWISEQNERFGVAEERLKGMAAGVGDLLVPLGFARSAAAGMSQEVLTLANALSEWTGGARSAEETTDILTKALLGEREALKSLGVSLTDADIKAELLARGMTGLTGTALQQAQAQISLELITRKSADAMAAYEEGSSDAMSAQKNLSAQMDTLKIAMGDLLVKLAPLVTVLAAAIDLLVKTLGFLEDQLDGNIEQLEEARAEIKKRAFEDLAQQVSFADRELGRSEIIAFLQSFLDLGGEIGRDAPQVRAAIASVIDPFAAATTRIRFGFELEDSFARGIAAGEAFKKAQEAAEQAAKDLAATFGGAFAENFKKNKDIGRAIEAAIKAVQQQQEINRLVAEIGNQLPAELVGGIVAGLDAEAAISALSGLLDNPEEIRRIARAIGFDIPAVAADGLRLNQGVFSAAASAWAALAALEATGAWNRNFNPRGNPPVAGTGPRVPGPNDLQFHDGGVVPGPAGADVPAILQAGETVIPAGGRAGTTVNVNVGGSVISEGDLVEAVRRGLRSDTIRGGSMEFA